MFQRTRRYPTNCRAEGTSVATGTLLTYIHMINATSSHSMICILLPFIDHWHPRTRVNYNPSLHRSCTRQHHRYIVLAHDNIIVTSFLHTTTSSLHRSCSRQHHHRYIVLAHDNIIIVTSFLHTTTSSLHRSFTRQHHRYIVLAHDNIRDP